MARTRLDLEAYRRRLRLRRFPAHGLDGLAELIAAHQREVPFENLDVLAGRRMSLGLGALQKKVLVEGRGGFCYELNVLFGELLRALGYEVSYLQARVSGSKLSPRFSHLCLKVQLGTPHLVDVGFGQFAQAPIPLADRAEVESNGFGYRLLRRGGRFDAEQRGADGRWERVYQLEARPYPLAAFLPRFTFQCSRDSFFARGPICVRADRAGWRLYYRSELTDARAGENVPRPVSDAQLRSVLLRRLRLSAAALDAALARRARWTGWTGLD